MLRRIRGLSEGSLRTLDRALVCGLIAVEVIDLSTNSELEGPAVAEHRGDDGDRRLVPVAPHAAIRHRSRARSWGWWSWRSG